MVRLSTIRYVTRTTFRRGYLLPDRTEIRVSTEGQIARALLRFYVRRITGSRVLDNRDLKLAKV